MTFTTLVRTGLVMELAATLLLGRWLHLAQGWDFAAVAGAAIALALVVRLAFVSAAMALAWFARTPRAPEHRLGPVGSAGLVLSEWRAIVANNFYFLPFAPVAMRPDPPLAGLGAPPVLLVHGYFSNRGILHGLVRALEEGGVRGISTFDFQAVVRPIGDYVAELEAQVVRALAQSGQPRLVIIAHSMGGLVTRAWMKRYGCERVAKVVTIASPHAGTVHAKLGAGRNAVDMCRGSAFFAGLCDGEGEKGPGIPFTSIYTVHDNLVTPQETSRLPWAKNIVLHGEGHVGVLNAPALHRAVLAELAGTGVRIGR